MNSLVPFKHLTFAMVIDVFIYCDLQDLMLIAVCLGFFSSTEPSPDQTQSFSLEEKSKTSKKRVHYMKFTKGEPATESVLCQLPDEL